jgi:hypothetical protein
MVEVTHVTADDGGDTNVKTNPQITSERLHQVPPGVSLLMNINGTSRLAIKAVGSDDLDSGNCSFEARSNFYASPAPRWAQPCSISRTET